MLNGVLGKCSEDTWACNDGSDNDQLEPSKAHNLLEYSTMTNSNTRQSAVLAVKSNQHEG